MKHAIGDTAGKIWRRLKSEGETSITNVPKLLDEKSPLAYMALGWLAREDKVEFRDEKGKTYVKVIE